MIYTVCYKVILKMIHSLIKYNIACRGKELCQIENIISSTYKSWKGQDKKSIDYDTPCEKKIQDEKW